MANTEQERAERRRRLWRIRDRIELRLSLALALLRGDNSELRRGALVFLAEPAYEPTEPTEPTKSTNSTCLPNRSRKGICRKSRLTNHTTRDWL